MKVCIENLPREFGDTIAVDDISFEFSTGQICGFIGPNGSGKTTTMRIMATVDEPTSGDVFYDDISCVEWPDTLHQHPHTTTFEYLDYFLRARLACAARNAGSVSRQSSSSSTPPTFATRS